MSLKILSKIETVLPKLLDPKFDDKWHSLYVDYEKPYVERVWTQYDDDEFGYLRIFLHVIHPCDETEALFHPHNWPSAMKILDGCYVQGIGFGSGSEIPPVAAKIEMTKGSTYEMTNIDSWHYVMPKVLTTTLMVIGKQWNRSWVPKPTKQLEPLAFERKIEILDHFRKIYGLNITSKSTNE